MLYNIKPHRLGLVEELPDMDFIQAVLDQSGWDYILYPRPALYVNGKPNRQIKRKNERHIYKLRKLN